MRDTNGPNMIPTPHKILSSEGSYPHAYGPTLALEALLASRQQYIIDHRSDSRGFDMEGFNLCQRAMRAEVAVRSSTAANYAAHRLMVPMLQQEKG